MFPVAVCCPSHFTGVSFNDCLFTGLHLEEPEFSSHIFGLADRASVSHGSTVRAQKTGVGSAERRREREREKWLKSSSGMSMMARLEI